MIDFDTVEVAAIISGAYNNGEVYTENSPEYERARDSIPSFAKKRLALLGNWITMMKIKPPTNVCR